MNWKQVVGKIAAAVLIVGGFVLMAGTTVWYVGWHEDLTSAQMLRATWHVLVLGTGSVFVGLYLADRVR